jgi:hypothetical protein
LCADGKGRGEVKREMIVKPNKSQVLLKRMPRAQLGDCDEQNIFNLELEQFCLEHDVSTKQLPTTDFYVKSDLNTSIKVASMCLLFVRLK